MDPMTYMIIQAKLVEFEDMRSSVPPRSSYVSLRDRLKKLFAIPPAKTTRARSCSEPVVI
jgi:hypothetical protein